MLRRLGCKRKLLPDLLRVFPEEIGTFVDLFMGTGAVSFAMSKRVTKKVIANDADAEVFNLFLVLKDRKQELIAAIEQTPIHAALWTHWKTHPETDPVWQAVRFLWFSNFGYMGQPETLRFEGVGQSKLILLKNLNRVAGILASETIDFLCCDFRDALAKISWRHKDFGRAANPKNRAFLYLDPPYMNTETNYFGRECVFRETETLDVFRVAMESGMRFAISEFDHPFVLEQARKNGLIIHELGERQTLKNRQKEILITNYEPKKRQMGLFAD